MRFIATPEFWALDAVSPGEWRMFEVLPETAAGGTAPPSALKRLYPSPFSDDTLADEETITRVEDWERYVKPELAGSFEEARRVVAADLADAETFPASELFDDPAEAAEALSALGEIDLRRLHVPLPHTEAWFSTLNQARLLLNEAHDIALDADRADSRAEGKDEEADPARRVLLAQYQLYTAVQSILVEHFMDADDASP